MLPYLPLDNINTVDKTVLETQNESLAQLLEQSETKFWITVESDASIAEYVGSFLRYCLRPHDLSLGPLSHASPSERQPAKGSNDNTSVEALDRTRQQRLSAWFEPTVRQLLMKRSFALILRLLTPWSTGADPSPLKSGRSHGEIISALQLVDLPKLMDLCAIYAPWNPRLTADAAGKMVRLRPSILVDLSTAGASVFPSNLQQILERSFDLLSAVTRDVHDNGSASKGGPSGSSSSAAASGASAAKTGLLDACAYLYDFSSTLYLTLACVPEGAASAALRRSSPALLETLASCYAGLLAPAHNLAQTGLAGTPLGSQLEHVTRLTGSTLQALAWILLKELHLTAASAAVGSEPDPRGKGRAGFEGSASDPAARGEAYLNTLLQLATMADIGGPQQGGLPNLLRGIAQRFQLERWTASAVHRGLLFLDDDQFDHLLTMCGGSAEDGAEHRIREARKSAPSSSKSRGPVASASSSAGPSDEAAALQLSVISGIKEIFGDMYGDGFLAACLEHFRNNSERVTEALLEGNLPPALQRLDPQMKVFVSSGVGSSSSNGPGPSSSSSAGAGSSSAAGASSSAASSSGKPPAAPTQLWLAAYAGLEPRDAGAVGGERHATAASASRAAGVAVVEVESSGGPRKGGKKGVDRSTARLLDAASNQTKRAALRLADLMTLMEAEGEYEDEFDDSLEGLAFYGPGGDKTLDEELEGGGKGGRGAGGGGPASSASPVPAQSAPAGRKGRGPPPKMWVVEGRVYNYDPKKPGAVPVATQEEADRMVAVQQAAREEIGGLGAGGNKARFAATAAPFNASRSPSASVSAPSSREPSAKGQPPAATGGSRVAAGPSSSGSQAGGEPSQRQKQLKEQGKLGSHHRKDRAMAKMSKGMF